MQCWDDGPDLSIQPELDEPPVLPLIEKPIEIWTMTSSRWTLAPHAVQVLPNPAKLVENRQDLSIQAEQKIRCLSGFSKAPAGLPNPAIAKSGDRTKQSE
jgi:hypothetical protein